MNIPPWLIKVSVCLNRWTCGPKGYSLCARFWEGRLNGHPFHTVMVTISNAILWRDPDHCRKAWLLRRNHN